MPLTVSGHAVRQANGETFYVNGDAAWSIMVELSRDEVTTYLEDRAAKGVNLVMCSLIEHEFNSRQPRWRSASGHDPFTSTIAGGLLDFTSPSEPYWSNVDWVLAEAERLGIVVLALPAYIGFEHGQDGWGAEVAANGPAGMAIYGDWLARRYADQSNIIWCMGGDYGPISGSSDLGTHYAALAGSLRAAGTGHLLTAHPDSGHLASEQYGTTYIDFDVAYAPYGSWLDGLHGEVRRGYERSSPTLPVLMIEAAYGNTYGSTNETVLRQMWHSVLGGAFGHIYGCSPVWYFGEGADHPGERFADSKGLTWSEQLDAFGASYLPHVATLFAMRDLSLLMPDYAHGVVTDGYGAENRDYAPALASEQVLVAFTPGRAIELDASRFRSGSFRVRWFSPIDGSVVDEAATVLGQGSRAFEPPDSRDWVLLLDDVSLELDSP